MWKEHVVWKKQSWWQQGGKIWSSSFAYKIKYQMISLCMSLKSVAAVESLIKNKNKKLASGIEMPNVY
jgi:hypothetical protein